VKNEKKGQITVFIIIGLILLFVIGTALYITRQKVTKEFEAVRPKVAELPSEVQPLRDFVDSCIRRLATDGLRKIGDSGGYIDTKFLSVDSMSPTDGEGVQLSPGKQPTIAYWWYLSSKNKCVPPDCLFDSKRPPLYRSGGSLSIEAQLDDYITKNMRGCLGNFEDFKKRGCNVEERGEPKVTANVAKDDVFFVGKYPLRATCGQQSYDVDEFYVTIDLNLREIYNLATEITNFQSQYRLLEEVTKQLIYTFSELDSEKLPPPRALQVGPPMPSMFWIKFEVERKLRMILESYIHFIQTSSVRNYDYVLPIEETDLERAEIMYNRQYLIPLNVSHPDIEVRFAYFDWWKPYFELSCNGQLCRADSGTNFQLLPFTINRYNFAYDVSFPALVEVRNPDAFNKEGYSFKIFLEANMRDSDVLRAETEPLEFAFVGKAPSIFCDPAQKTSGVVGAQVKDGKTLKGLNEAAVSYLCGNRNCNIGVTSNGILNSRYPRCIGGIFRVTKQGYSTYSTLLDTSREEGMNISLMLEPVRYLNATIKNLPITKIGKFGEWDYREGAALRPPDGQMAAIQLIRIGTPYDESFISAIQIEGDGSAELALIPGNYTIRISSFLKYTAGANSSIKGEIIIPPDERCFKIKKLFKSKKKCTMVPQEPIIFNETSPFPYGGAEFEYEFTSSMLRAADEIEFRQFIIALDRVPQENRIVEDLEQLTRVNLYSKAGIDKVRPVIK